MHHNTLMKKMIAHPAHPISASSSLLLSLLRSTVPWLLLSLCTQQNRLVVDAVPALQESVLCRTEAHGIPISEIIFSAFPDSIDLKNKPFIRELTFSSSRLLGDLSQATLPFHNWFADGVYSIITPDVREDPRGAEFFALITKISIIQSSCAKYDYFCSWLMPYVSWVPSRCHCSRSSRWTQLAGEDSHICKCDLNCAKTTVSQAQGLCQAYVDPNRPSCVVIEHQPFPPPAIDHEHHNDPESATAASTPINATAELSRFIHYHSSFPTLVEYLPTKLKSTATPKDKILRLVVLGCSYVPFYLFNLVLGLGILSQAEDIAENKYYLIVIEAIVGMMLALFLLLFLFHHYIDKFVSRNGNDSWRFLDGVLGASFLSISVWNIRLVPIIRDKLFDFWDSGVLGYEWIGKVYIIGCILLTWLVCWRFKLFEVDTWSFSVIVFSVKFLGVVFIAHSSSSNVVSTIVIVLGLAAGYLRDSIYYISLIISASRLPSRQRRISDKQLSVTVDSFTKKQLEKLRERLQKHPRLVSQFTEQMIEEDKPEVLNRLKAFVSNQYSGKPRVADDDDVETVPFFQTKVGKLSVVIFAGLALYGLAQMPAGFIKTLFSTS